MIWVERVLFALGALVLFAIVYGAADDIQTSLHCKDLGMKWRDGVCVDLP